MAKEAKKELESAEERPAEEPEEEKEAAKEAGKPAEKVGEEAALEILTELKDDSAVDRHLADQLMVFAAVAEGKTSYTTSEITLHQKSNAYVISRFLGDVVKLEGKRVEIKGCGLI